MKSWLTAPAAAGVVSPPRISHAPVVLDRRLDDISEPSSRLTRASEPGTAIPDYVVNVSRPVEPWRWTSVLLAPVELLVVVWSVPVAILLVGIPIAFTVSLVYWVGRFLLSYF